MRNTIKKAKGCNITDSPLTQRADPPDGARDDAGLKGMMGQRVGFICFEKHKKYFTLYKSKN
ncbi:hypothetical protein MTBPR1_20293 [Candidatus Terasakiella magnetica]|uniref:Uncharacterized protein n=1 Tax=Candidatus Terasakiella magnetica TaxID=1867952 RepID=A0A1C3RGQ2_9PROT|nr:hypothetical protein MTBPR1_20293 [Candidatus Terasakiella magnetica]